MERVIHVTVRDKIATAPKEALYVCGNSDYSIQFDFDEEWLEYTHKTARFNCGPEPIDVVFSGNICPVPKISNVTHFYVGAYAGDLRTTTPAYVSAKKSILCGSGSPKPPTPDVYAQIMEILNTLKVEIPPEQIDAAVNEWLEDNPVEPGATEEQAEQIQKNKEDIEELKRNGTGGGISKETDPTVPSWAKQPIKPTYTAGEVGADPAGTATAAIGEHNVSGDAHEDIRQLIISLSNRLNGIADSDDTTMDQLSEIVAYIKSNKSLIDAITTGKISTTDIVDNLTTNVGTKVLSAAQGVVLKGLIDGMVSQLNEQKEAVDDKLDASELPTAINTALEQAKESGQFDGAPGAKGDPGDDYVLTEADKEEIAEMAAGMVEVPEGGGGYTLPVASPSQLGGVKPAAKTDEMTQAVGVDEEGKLWGMPGGSGGEEVVILLDTTLEEETSRVSVNCPNEILNKLKNNLKSFHMVYKTEPPADETITSEGYICMGMGRAGVGDGFGVNSGNASNGTPAYGGKAKFGYYTVIPYQPFEIAAITGGYGGETPTIAAMRRQKGDYAVEEIIKTVTWQRANANEFYFKTDKVFGVGSRFAIALLF